MKYLIGGALLVDALASSWSEILMAHCSFEPFGINIATAWVSSTSAQHNKLICDVKHVP